MEQKIIYGDCLEEMRKLESGSVDLILTDPPYGTIKGLGGDIEKYKLLSNSIWDNAINPTDMFNECERVLRKNGKLILFSQEPYTSKMINESIGNLPFLYRMVWLKDHFANCLVVNKAPVSYFEDILVFGKRHDKNALHPLRYYGLNIKKHIKYSRRRLYKELGNGGSQHFLESNDESSQFCLCTEETYGKLIELYHFDNEEWFIEYQELKRVDDEFKNNFSSIFNLWEGNKLKSNILNYKKDYGGLHPTQKPVDLLNDLIRTYSDEGDTVLDFTMGSGSTGVACKKSNRNFIGIELDEKYFEIAKKRLATHKN